jgi:hypothetical protein
MIYTYKKTNKKWFGHTVYKCFLENKFQGFRIKVPALTLKRTKNGYKEVKNGYQYKTIDRIQWDQNGNKIYMTWEELEKTFD